MCVDCGCSNGAKATVTNAKTGKVSELWRNIVGHLHDAGHIHAPGNNAPIGGIKVITASGWFAARPSGTEDIYKIYAESFKDKAHLQLILKETQSIVDTAIAAQ